MPVNGFLVDNAVQKYNYESLENYNTPDFSTSSTYQVGDYVMYQGKLYKCTTAITTSGAWDSTKWSLAILSDDVADLKSVVTKGGRVWNAILDGNCDPTNTSDCKTIIQNAFNNFPDGTIFYFPAGRYKISGAITINGKKDYKIIGDGASWGVGTRFYSSASYGFLTINGGENIEISDILFFGNDISTASAITFGDTTPTTMDCRVNKVYVHDILIQGFKYGVRISCPTGYMFFHRVFISRIMAGGDGFSIGANYANTATTEEGYTIIPNNIHIVECAIDDLKNGAANSGIAIYCAQYIFIRDCDICNFTDGSRGYAVSLVNNIPANKKLEQISVVNNSLYSNRIGIFVSNRDATAKIEYLDFSHNIIVGRLNQGSGAESGIAITKTSGSTNSANVTVIGNTFKHFNDGFTNLSYMQEIGTTLYKAGVGV